MRLTLRTLLAYLDNTLDPQDSEILKNKLAESGFATQLVQRIHELQKRSDLSAPSPLARGPVEDANVICEYLDSTLPVEQVAEVERACLDSDPHLAEAAACHQILTMVLDNPANVTVVLRDRIYQLPGEQRGGNEHGGSFSALAIPESVNSFDSPSSPLLSDEVLPPPEREPVRPVGVSDSGVMAAPARFRNHELDDDSASKRESAIAGSKPMTRQAAGGIYEGQIRASRITPWLVTLGLAAVLLYALTQIFQPLLDSDDVADKSGLNQQLPLLDDAINGASEDEEGSPERLPDSGVADTASDDVGRVAGNENVDLQTGPEPEKGEGDETEEIGVLAPKVGQGSVPNVGEGSTDADDLKQPGDAQPSDSDDSRTENEAEMKPPGTTVNDALSGTTTTPMGKDSDNVKSGSEAADAKEPPSKGSDLPDGGSDASPDGNEDSAALLAKVVSKKTLLATEIDGQWQRLSVDAEVAAGQKLVVGPTFRATLVTPNSEFTLIGPAAAVLIGGTEGRLGVHLNSGRMLVSGVEPGAAFEIQLAEADLALEFASPDSLAAIQVHHTRAPSLDPLIPDNHVSMRQITAVKGGLTVVTQGESQTLEADTQWNQQGAGKPTVESVDDAPVWATDNKVDALDAAAQGDLLALIEGAPSMEIALREQLGFRRSEVAALAARTLLGLGKPDVYFGGAGVFNDPRQRAFWPQHYDAVLARFDDSPQAADEIQRAIIKMDSASAAKLFRMLTGYTDEQLASGSDLQLLENLDSADMSVRVMAFENLRRITGVTFNFRAEQDSKGRREQYLKRWNVLQRKGEIRWKKQ